MKPVKYVFWDMDGVLFPWNADATEKELHSRNYYANMQPDKKMLQTMKDTIKDDVKNHHFILSAYLCPHAKAGKKKALEKLAVIDPDNYIFVPYGESKVAMAEKFLQFHLNKDCILIDDHSPNCREWEAAGGTAIKVMNGQNGRNGTWQGYKMSLNGEITIPDTIPSAEGAQRLMYGIWEQALLDLRNLDIGKKLEDTSIAEIYRWMKDSPFNVNGDLVIDALAVHGTDNICHEMAL